MQIHRLGKYFTLIRSILSNRTVNRIISDCYIREYYKPELDPDYNHIFGVHNFIHLMYCMEVFDLPCTSSYTYKQEFIIIIMISVLQVINYVSHHNVSL